MIRLYIVILRVNFDAMRGVKWGHTPEQYRKYCDGIDSTLRQSNARNLLLKRDVFRINILIWILNSIE